MKFINYVKYRDLDKIAGARPAHFAYADRLRDQGKLAIGGRILLQPKEAKGNPVPGGLAITRDGSRMFVAAANLNAVIEVDLTKNEVVKSYPVQNLPFEARLSEDERTLIVSNWGGHLAKAGETRAVTLVFVARDGLRAQAFIDALADSWGMSTHFGRTYLWAERPVAAGNDPRGDAVGV